MSGLLFALALVSLLMAACGGDDAPSTPGVTVTAGPSVSATASPGAGATSAPSGAASSPTPPPAASQRGASADAFRGTDYPDDLTDGFSFGSPDAPIVLTIFEDFQCPFCLKFSVVSEPTIVREFVLTGKVRLEFRNLPILGRESANAAIAAQCAADQDRFWPYMKALFLAQHDAGQLVNEKIDVGRFSPDPLIAMAEVVGADRAAFETCLYSDEAAAAVTEHLRQANDLGLRSTPSFLVNGDHEPNFPADGPGWSAYLNEKLRGS